jgi:RNA polymerase sigma-70 factor (ECF subfamily)
VTLAFLTVLQQLPGRQRAVLLLRDVLDWKAQDVAACLDLTLAAVNSALQRARATLKKYQEQRAVIKSTLAGDAHITALLSRYVTACEDADADGLVALLREDAILTMPPLPAWYQGSRAIRDFFALHLFQGLPRGSFRLAATRANACPALAVYQRAGDGVFRPASLQVLTLDQGRIARIDCFLVSDDHLFRRFNLPLTD